MAATEVPPKQRTPPALTPIPPSPRPEPAPEPPEPAPPAARRRFHFVTSVGWLTIMVAVPVLFSHAAVALLRWVPPPTSAFMLQSPVQPVDYRWIPAERMAEVLRKAAVASEDQKFWTHQGFDFEAIDQALEHNRNNRRKRGASTITQQVVKNLFLWPSRSWVRKGFEVYGTLLIELLWSKDRILEIYLNIAEFGPGIYGVEAASQKYFAKPASSLTPEEAARLVAILPNPRKWRAVNAGPYVQARTETILALMGYRKPEPIPEEELVPLSPEEPAPEDVNGLAPPPTAGATQPSPATPAPAPAPEPAPPAQAEEPAAPEAEAPAEAAPQGPAAAEDESP